MKGFRSALALVVLSAGSSSSYLTAAQTIGASSGSTAAGATGVAGVNLLRATGVPPSPTFFPSALNLSPILLTPSIIPASSPLSTLTPAESKPDERQAAEAQKTFDGGALKSDLSAAVAADGAPDASRAAALAAAPKALWAPQTVGTPLANDSMDVTIHRLSNGMTAYLSPNRLQPRVTAHIAVRAGARQDPTDSTGMAHYLEHMLFKGTERLGTTNYEAEKPHLERISSLYEDLFKERNPERRRALYAEIDTENQKASAYAIPNEFDRLYAGLGFENIDAHTNTEETVYQVSFPSNRSEAWARTEADRFAHPVFRLFQSELEAVYEENNMRQDDADPAMWEATRAGTFKGHPYARSIIGLPAHLKNPSLAKMYAFYDTWYRPDNMAMVLSGDFDRAEMLATLERNFGALRARTATTPVLPPAAFDPLKGVERSEIFYPGEETMRVSWRTPAQGHSDVDALAVLEHLLGDEQSGLLNLHLSQAQKIKDAWGDVWQMNETGAFLINASPKAGQSLEQAEALVLAEIERVKAGDFSEETLRAVIMNLEVGEKRRLESDDERVDAMLQSYIAGEEWRRNVERLERLRRVTKADLVRVARAYLGKDRAVVYRRQGAIKHPPIEKPGFTPIGIDTTRHSPFADELAATPAPELKPRWLKDKDDYVVDSFVWGKLYWAKNPVNDLFSLTFKIPGGYRADPRMPIAAELLSASGADDMTPAEFEQALASLGTRMEFECGENDCEVKITGLEKNLKESLRLTALRFTRPNIPRGTLQKLVKIELGARKDRRQDPEDIGEALREYAERGRDSAVLADLSRKQILSLRTDELRRLLAGTLESQRLVLYAGTTSPKEVARLSTLGRRRWNPAPRRAPRTVAVPDKPQVIFVHRKGMVQAHIGLIASDGPSDASEAVARRLYNTVIGGMGGVIFQEVREARSLAYSAQGEYQPGERSGDDAAQFGWVASQADKAVEAAALMSEILKRPSFGAERFDTAAREVLAYYRTRAIPFREIPEQLLAWEQQGMGTGDPRAALMEKAAAFRHEDFEAFGRRLQGRTLTIYVVGDRDKLDMDGLKRLGDFREVSPNAIFPR